MNWDRWWPLTGVVFVPLWIVGLILHHTPNTSHTDASILAHYAKHSNRVKDFVGFFFILAAVLVFVWFLAHIRKRLALLEGGQPLRTAVVFGSGLVAGALWIVANALYTAPTAAIQDTSKFTLDPNTFRILNDLGYGVWFSGTTMFALGVLSIAVLSRRTGFLPRWLTWLSFPVGIIMLVSFLFFPFLIFLGWMLVTSITLIARPQPAAAPPTPV